MDGLPIGPWVWAQATTPKVDEAVALLALRRWYTSLTLSSPEAAPSRYALGAWLTGLGALLLLAIVIQGPRRALGQLFDLPGHVRLAGAALGRFRNAVRPVAILLGVTVLTWTISQFRHYREPDRLEDLSTFAKAKTISEIATEQATLAALVPMRDLFGLGDVLILTILATILVFKLSADRWGHLEAPGVAGRPPLPGWTTLCWGCTWLYAMYRFASLVVATDGLPLGGCTFIEAGIIPLLMASADGILLAWILVELRNAGLGQAGAEGLDLRGAVAQWPGAILACLLALPARYAGTGAWLLLSDLPRLASRLTLLSLVRGWGLVALQGAALTTVGLAGAAAWWGGAGGSLRGYLRLLRAEGGRLVATLALTGALAGGLAGLAYVLVLSLPAQPWVLAAADSYAHYATLPIGLVALAALVELGGRALPEANRAPTGEEELPWGEPARSGTQARAQAGAADLPAS